jgi:hypothetical protein
LGSTKREDEIEVEADGRSRRVLIVLWRGMAWPFWGQGHTSVIGVLHWLLFLMEKGEAMMPKLRNGHAAGHVREAACDAFQAWMVWDGTPLQATVEYEIHYVPTSRIAYRSRERAG